MRKYVYTNDMGYHKFLTLTPLENGNYDAMLWCTDNGEYCGSGEVTQEWVDEILRRYPDIREVSAS